MTINTLILNTLLAAKKYI